jgi:hypothetical protein
MYIYIYIYSHKHSGCLYIRLYTITQENSKIRHNGFPAHMFQFIIHYHLTTAHSTT